MILQSPTSGDSIRKRCVPATCCWQGILVHLHAKETRPFTQKREENWGNERARPAPHKLRPTRFASGVSNQKRTLQGRANEMKEQIEGNRVLSRSFIQNTAAMGIDKGAKANLPGYQAQLHKQEAYSYLMEHFAKRSIQLHDASWRADKRLSTLLKVLLLLRGQCPGARVHCMYVHIKLLFLKAAKATISTARA